MIETPRVREPWIDWLRAIAAIAVVIFHLNEVRQARGDWYAPVAAYGWLGVPVFFVVSGYCVMLSSRGVGAGEFLVRRYVRVLPPYWASVVVVLAVAAFRKLAAGVNDVTAIHTDPVSLLAMLTLTTQPVSHVATINWVYWTLSYELAFYGLMAIGLIRRAALAPLMIVLTALSFVQLFYPIADLPGLFFLHHWPLFSCGAGMALMLNERGIGGKILFVLGLIGIPATEALAPTLAAMLTIGSILIVAWRPRLNNALQSRTMNVLGRISYSLYLTHVPIGVYLLGHLTTAGAAVSIPAKIGFDLLLLIGCLAFAYLFNRAVELPAQRWSRALLNGKPQPTGPAAGEGDPNAASAPRETEWRPT